MTCVRFMGLESAPAVSVPRVTGSTPAVTSAPVQRPKTLPAWRAECRARASTIVALGTQAVTMEAVAQSLGVDRSAVSHWCDPGHRAAMAVGDVLASPPAVTESVGLALVAHARERMPSTIPARIGVDRRARRATVAHGRLLEVVDDALSDDGVIDRSEARDILRATREAQERLDAIVQELALAAPGGQRT